MVRFLETITGYSGLTKYVESNPTVGQYYFEATKFGLDNRIAGTIFLSYVINQLTEPVRLAALVYIVPRASAYLEGRR